MRVTTCDNCETELMREKDSVDMYYPTIYTITEIPGRNSFTHSDLVLNHEPNYTKHFCSKDCIGKYYASSIIPKHENNVSAPSEIDYLKKEQERLKEELMKEKRK